MSKLQTCAYPHLDCQYCDTSAQTTHDSEKKTDEMHTPIYSAMRTHDAHIVLGVNLSSVLQKHEHDTRTPMHSGKYQRIVSALCVKHV